MKIIFIQMKIELTKRPKNCILIEGFPGFGLVSTITTEFLIDHLKAEQIGKILLSGKMSPMVAVHNNKIVDPLGVFYDKQNNLIILHALTGVNGLEWEIVEAVNDLCKMLDIKEVIGLEGVGTVGGMGEKSGAYFYSKDSKKWNSLGIPPLKEGVVVGVTGALLLNLKGPKLSCVFTETKSNLPDSRAAAKMIEVLDNYLGLNVDYKPLLKKAVEFENKLKGILDQTKQASIQKLKRNRDVDYVG